MPCHRESNVVLEVPVADDLLKPQVSESGYKLARKS